MKTERGSCRDQDHRDFGLGNKQSMQLKISKEEVQAGQNDFRVEEEQKGRKYSRIEECTSIRENHRKRNAPAFCIKKSWRKL